MPYSQAQTVQLNCQQCQKPFPFEVWLIVDTKEKPELLERIERGELHDAICPHCGLVGMVDTPLLLYRPGEKEPLLFAPARETNEEQDQQQAQGLLSELAVELGDDWQDEWLEQLQVVPQEMLPLALAGPEEQELALQRLVEQRQHQLEELKKVDPEGYRSLMESAKRAEETLAILQVFVQLPTPVAAQTMVESHPELLEEEAAKLLQNMIEGAQREGDKSTAALLLNRQSLLQRCHQVGVAQAFAGLDIEES